MAYREMANHGYKLSWHNGTTYELINGVDDIEVDGVKVEEIDRTHNNDTRKRKLPGRPDFQNVKFTIAFDPQDTIHQAINAKCETPTPWAESLLKFEYPRGLATEPSLILHGFPTDWKEKGAGNSAGLYHVDVTFAVDNVVRSAGTPAP